MSVSSFGVSTSAQNLVVANSPLTTSGTITLNRSAEYNAGSATSSVAINWNNGAKQRVTLTSGRAVTLPSTVKYPHGIGTPWTVSTFANTPCAVTFSNPADGNRYAIRFIQGDTLIVDEVIFDYVNGVYNAISYTIYDPNARNSTYSSLFPNNVVDYISVPDSASFAFGVNGLTVSGWFYTTAASTQQTIIEKFSDIQPDGTQDGFQLNLCGQNSDDLVPTGGVITQKMSLYCGNNSTHTFQRVDTGVTILSNTWYHAAATYSGTTVTFYVNGALSSTITGVASITVPDSSSPLHIGASINNSPSNDPWIGYLRDVCVYNKALTSGNIAAIYNSRRPPDLANASSCSGFLSNLVAWWKLGDGDSVTSWADSSGNGHTGTTTGTLNIVKVYPNV